MNKKILFLFLLNITSLCLTAQRTLKIYFTDKWLITQNKKDAEYYRVINLNSENKPVGLVRDYFMNGKLQYEANKIYVDTIDPRNDTTDGFARWYSKKGQLVHEAFYVHGKKQGEHKYWYDTGVLKSISHFKDDLLDGDYVSYYDNGNYRTKIKYNLGAIEGKKGFYYNRYLTIHDYFYDSFSQPNNTYGWKLPVGDDIKSKIVVDTGLFIQNNSSRDVIALVDIPLNEKRGFDLSIDIKKDSGEPTAGYGIVYDYKDENNYSYFLIRFDGYFLTGRLLNGIERGNGLWVKTKYLLGNAMTDRIYIYRYGTELHFYINSKKVATGSYVPFTGNNIGVICQKGGQSILLKLISILQW